MGSDSDGESPNEAETADGPTNDLTPGLGIEFECGQIQLAPKDTKNAQQTSEIVKSKHKVIDDRTGPNWELTADTSVDGKINAEYVLSGRTIKLGQNGAAGTAAQAVAQDLAGWNPSAKMAKFDEIDVQDSTLNPWQVIQPAGIGQAASFQWAMQATAPLPLEAISDIFSQSAKTAGIIAANIAQPLLPKTTSNNMVSVRQEFFQANPGGLSSPNVKADVLGFFSLLVSYAKAAKGLAEDESPKDLTSIMPRTDFSTIFEQVKDQIQGSLYEILKILVCYQIIPDKDTVEFDSTLCDGDMEKPVPKPGALDGKAFVLESAGQYHKLTVKDWIESIQNGEKPDRLSQLDTVIDGSIGGLGSRLENVLGTQRAVPLFEFRRLPNTNAANMKSRVEAIEKEIMRYHGLYTAAPRVRRNYDAKHPHVRRQNASTDCPAATSSDIQTTAAPSTTSAPAVPSCSLQNEDPDQGINTQGCICGSMTLPLLTVSSATDEGQSCAYTAMPSSAVSNPISKSTQIYTSNCQACTIVGGIADSPTCTSVGGCTATSSIASPTCTIHLSNNSVPIGDANDKDNGSDLRDKLLSKLQALCPDNAQSCNSKKTAEIDQIPTVENNSVVKEKLTFTIEDSSYNDTKSRDQMLVGAVASWQQAAAKSCSVVQYGDICGDSPVKRDRFLDSDLDKRNPVQNPGQKLSCGYNGTICAGPDHITAALGSNFLDIGVQEMLEGNAAFNAFVCEIVIEALSALVMAVAPEFAPAETLGDIEFESLCEELGQVGQA